MTGGDEAADVVVVGAGPAGSAAAAWAARAGRDVTVVDTATFPRDKACGDGLTPRAMGELHHLGLGDWIAGRIAHRGLRMSGFGADVEVVWPRGSFPAVSSAVPRTELDERIRVVAEQSGARMRLGCAAVAVAHDAAGRVESVTLADGSVLSCRALVVADGVRSPLGRLLGRTWHRDTVYGVAIRAYIKTPRGDEPWITSHLELRSADGSCQPGYGWIFPLGDGSANIGVGALATARRPSDAALRPLLAHYAELRRADWAIDGEPRLARSALLPMGGAVSGVAGPNWLLIGDAAGCVNPLNGEGIDYALETGRLAAGLLAGRAEVTGLAQVWPQELRRHYGRGFSVARRLAALLTLPRFLPLTGPVAMRSEHLMTLAVRVMGNLVSEEDTDVVARLWRRAGAGSNRLDARAPFS